MQISYNSKLRNTDTKAKTATTATTVPATKAAFTVAEAESGVGSSVGAKLRIGDEVVGDAVKAGSSQPEQAPQFPVIKQFMPANEHTPPPETYTNLIY